MSMYPTVRPSLTLDFQKSKQLDPRISFSRSSTATYVEGGVVKYADEHQARFEEEGLLIEESRTNIFDQSEDVESWSSGRWTKTNNVAISPDGTQNAGSIVPIIGTTSQSTGRTVTQSAGNYTCSVFAKPNGLTILKIKTNGASFQARFVLTGDGSIYSASNGTASIYKYPNGWYKCIFTINDTVGVINQWLIGHTDSSNVDGTNGFYIWGMQVEAGTFPTSYIPTSGSTVTRAADVATITGTNFSSWYNQSEGTVFAEANASGFSGVVGFNDGGSDRWRIGFAGANNSAVVVVDGGVVQVNTNTPANSTPYNQYHKLCVAISENNLSLSYNGTLALDSSLSVPSASELTIGSAIGISGAIDGHISRLAYYSRRLTDSELQTITL